MLPEKAGHYPGVSYEEYHSWPFASSSRLKLFYDQTPAHAQYDLLHPDDPRPAMALGSATHQILLEGPEVFRGQFLLAPKVDRRTREGKATWNALLEEAQGRTLLTEPDYQRALGMVESLWRRETVRNILGAKGHNELSCVWDEAGARCKMRTDILRLVAGYPMVFDLKTSRSATRGFFSREIANMAYHLQAGFYCRGLERLFAAEHRYGFIVVESEPPFEVAVFELDREDIDRGTQLALDCLARWRECEKSGNWPGYPDQLMPIGLPAWARKGQEGAWE